MKRRATVSRPLTFSQAQGLEPLPGPLALEELPDTVRNRLWDIIYRMSVQHHDGMWAAIDDPWKAVLADMHVQFWNAVSDDFKPSLDHVRSTYKDFLLEAGRYNRVFDLLQDIMRHPLCPRGFRGRVKSVFEECQMAYFVDVSGPPTIIPAATETEGETVRSALQELRDAGMNQARDHLRRAGEHLNQGNWPESTRESITAVESTAKSLGLGGNTLGEVLKKLPDDWQVHPALRAGLDKLYGWTSDRLRHGVTDSAAQATPVGREEALLMLGACASFCTYLLGKRRSAASSRVPGRRR